MQKVIRSLDVLQHKYRFLGFSYGVIKKYGDDKAGYEAALLTYYGFLALFPLLLVVSTIVGIAANRDPHLQETFINSLTNYFPTLGTQLAAHIHSIHKTGIALVIGVILTIFGARGVADAFRHGIYTIWRVPPASRPSSPKSILTSLSIIFVGGIGFILASLTAGYAGAVGHGILFRILSILINIIILFILFTVLLQITLPKEVNFKQTNIGALSAAIGLVILQSLGSYVLAHELKNLDSLYSTFAVTLGLLFWIYLQAQMFYYAVEISTVSAWKLWPRAINSNQPSTIDIEELKRLAPLNKINHF